MVKVVRWSLEGVGVDVLDLGILVCLGSLLLDLQEVSQESGGGVGLLLLRREYLLVLVPVLGRCRLSRKLGWLKGGGVEGLGWFRGISHSRKAMV